MTRSACEFIQQLREVSESSSSSSASSDAEDLEETMYQEGGHQSLTESLAEPEFSGLWDQNSKVQQKNNHCQLNANPCKLLKLKHS